MKTLEKISNVVHKILTVVIIILFLLMFGITNLGVIMRYFFNSPIIISVEMGRYCFVSIIFLGAILTTKQDRHIHVDFFVGLMSEKMRHFIDQAGRVLMMGFFGLLTVYVLRMVVMNLHVPSSAMQIPMAVPYGIMAVGCFGIALESAINILANHLGVKREDDKTEEVEE